MKHAILSLSLLLAAASYAPAAAVPFPDVPAAKEQAQAQQKPALILWYGSDWLPGSESLCREWKHLENMLKEGGTSPVILGQFDEKLGMKDRLSNKTMPLEQYNLPVAVLLAPDGTLVACYSGELARHAEALVPQVRAALKQLPAFTGLVKRARATEGAEGARAAGDALSLLRLSDAMLHRELRDIINRKDPDNLTGYRALFGMDHLDMYKQIGLLLQGGADGTLKGKDRDFDAAERFVTAMLDNKRLSGERLQQWLAGLAYIQRERMLAEGDKDRSALLKTLARIVSIDPKSEYGKGAARFHHYWNPDSFYTIEGNYYSGAEQTLRFEKDWHVRVTESIDGPGNYVFSLLPLDNGSMVTRNYRLVVDGKVIAQAAEPAEQNTKTAHFTVPDIPRGARVEVWLTAQCNDGWLGCSGHIEMKKADTPR